jgi:hypothetical protein
MSDVFDRDAKEAALAKVLAREFNRARLQLLGLIPGLDPWMVDVAPEFWADHRANLVGVTTPLMSGVFVAQAETLLEEFDFLGVEWGLVNEAAVDWARGYTFDLVKGINTTSQRTLQKLIPGYFENQWTQGQLSEQLVPTFGVKRAGVIARTEVTRAATEGELATVAELAKDGINMKPFHETRNDELVCPICGPRHGKEITDGEFAPLHPNCRCWTRHELVSE